MITALSHNSSHQPPQWRAEQVAVLVAERLRAHSSSRDASGSGSSGSSGGSSGGTGDGGCGRSGSSSASTSKMAEEVLSAMAHAKRAEERADAWEQKAKKAAAEASEWRSSAKVLASLLNQLGEETSPAVRVGGVGVGGVAGVGSIGSVAGGQKLLVEMPPSSPALHGHSPASRSPTSQAPSCAAQLPTPLLISHDEIIDQKPHGGTPKLKLGAAAPQWRSCTLWRLAGRDRPRVTTCLPLPCRHRPSPSPSWHAPPRPLHRLGLGLGHRIRGGRGRHCWRHRQRTRGSGAGTHGGVGGVVGSGRLAHLRRDRLRPLARR